MNNCGNEKIRELTHTFHEERNDQAGQEVLVGEAATEYNRRPRCSGKIEPGRRRKGVLHLLVTGIMARWLKEEWRIVGKWRWLREYLPSSPSPRSDDDYDYCKRQLFRPAQYSKFGGTWHPEDTEDSHPAEPTYLNFIRFQMAIQPSIYRYIRKRIP